MSISDRFVTVWPIVVLFPASLRGQDIAVPRGRQPCRACVWEKLINSFAFNKLRLDVIGGPRRVVAVEISREDDAHCPLIFLDIGYYCVLNCREC